jgi:hypothetical protein
MFWDNLLQNARGDPVFQGIDAFHDRIDALHGALFVSAGRPGCSPPPRSLAASSCSAAGAQSDRRRGARIHALQLRLGATSMRGQARWPVGGPPARCAARPRREPDPAAYLTELALAGSVRE